MKLILKEVPQQTKYTIEFDQDELYLLYQVLGETSARQREELFGYKYGDLGAKLYRELDKIVEEK